MSKAHFIIKKNSQKIQDSIKNSLTSEQLDEISLYITGTKEYDVDFVDNNYKDDYVDATYNKGRLLLLHNEGVVNYISISEMENDGRNSSVQSVPTAYNFYFKNDKSPKKLYYYFLHSMNKELTDYHFFIYRLMSTIEFEFINAKQEIKDKIKPFSSIDEIMIARNILSRKNRGNNSTYINKTAKHTYEIYGKTYGANKYETTLMCYAISYLMDDSDEVILYEMVDNGLSELPKSCLDVIKTFDCIKDIPLNLTLEKRLITGANTNLRSPRYISALFNKLGPKKCLLCECEVSELIEGAHIWEIQQIKNESSLSDDEKFKYATDGENGIWLCENHHKLFDEGIIKIEPSGDIVIKNELNTNDLNYINSITTNSSIPQEVMTVKFIGYLAKRYAV